MKTFYSVSVEDADIRQAVAEAKQHNEDTGELSFVVCCGVAIHAFLAFDAVTPIEQQIYNATHAIKSGATA